MLCVDPGALLVCLLLVLGSQNSRDLADVRLKHAPPEKNDGVERHYSMLNNNGISSNDPGSKSGGETGRTTRKEKNRNAVEFFDCSVRRSQHQKDSMSWLMGRTKCVCFFESRPLDLTPRLKKHPQGSERQAFILHQRPAKSKRSTSVTVAAPEDQSVQTGAQTAREHAKHDHCM